MNAQLLSDAIGLVDSELLEEAERFRQRPGKERARPRLLRWGMAAACLCVLLCGALILPRILPGTPAAGGAETGGVTITKIDQAPAGTTSSGDLAWYTEEELFTRFPTLIFRGEVLSLQNLAVDFAGEVSYRAVAEIRVDEVLRGDCASGDVLTVLLPCPVSDDVWVEDCDTLAALQTGMSGIFMPVAYDDGSVWEQNGKTLQLTELAEYGFLDGLRFAFLETGDGLLYSREAYPGLDGAQTLDEADSYIRGMAGEH